MSKQRKVRDSIVYVGSQKPVLEYVMACMQAVKSCGEVVIKSRGRAISNAVDVAEVLRNRFLELDVIGVEIGTEEIEGKRLSAITIELRPRP